MKKKATLTQEITLQTICESIKNWDHAQGTSATLQTLLATCTGFSIPPIPQAQQSTDNTYHAYIGLNKTAMTDKLEFYLISAANDTKTGIQDSRNIILCTTLSAELLTGNDLLPGSEGPLRVSNWRNNYRNWIRDEHDEERGIFQAWEVPLSDLDLTKVNTAYFGLAVSSDKSSADLIISPSTTPKMYYDLVRPVPPFKSGVSKYYLLVHSLE